MGDDFMLYVLCHWLLVCVMMCVQNLVDRFQPNSWHLKLLVRLHWKVQGLFYLVIISIVFIYLSLPDSWQSRQWAQRAWRWRISRSSTGSGKRLVERSNGGSCQRSKQLINHNALSFSLSLSHSFALCICISKGKGQLKRKLNLRKELKLRGVERLKVEY